MRIRENEDEESPDINIAPLLDCIFLLLIFFLLTSTIQRTEDEKKTKEQELLLELPESAAAIDAAKQPEPLIIQIDSSGRYYVDKSRIGIERLHNILRDTATNDPGRKIRIEGDERASFEYIAHAIDLCEFEGLDEIAIRTMDK